LSSVSQNERAKIREEFSREIRQFTGINASFFRVAATRIGIAVTDMQVLDILDLIGPATAGQLADLTGLTTGAITRILNRLEEAKLVFRERDPNDGRKVIVQLTQSKDKMRQIRSILDATEKVWDEVASRYTDEQLAFLMEFLKHSAMLSRRELVQWQGVPLDEREIFSAPLENQERGRLIVSCGTSRLTVRANEERAQLYQARFEGPVPKVNVKPVPGVQGKEEIVSIHYPRRLLGVSEKQGEAEVKLSGAIPWRIVIHGGAAEVVVGGLDLAGLEVIGGFHTIRLDLPAPSGVVPIRISGGASEIAMRRPVGVAVRMKLKGWVSQLALDEQTLTGAGNNLQLHSPSLDPATPYYDLEIKSYAHSVVITSG
jgi:DNA-binding MarR family transcriptional regulator